MPLRTITFGLPSAKSRLFVLLKIGFACMPLGGETARSSCTNPPMSPNPLISGAPFVGLITHSTAVCSMPSTHGFQRVGSSALTFVNSRVA